MKKIASLFIALCSMALITAKAEVINGTIVEDKLFWSYDTDTKVLTFTGEGSIPDNELDKTPWSAYRKEALRIVLPEKLTGIGAYAFHGFEAVTSIVIPDNVTIIDQYAFQNCFALHECHIGENVQSIRQYAFSDCFSLTSVTVPNSAQDIKYRAFDNVPNIVYLDGRTSNYGARTINGFIEKDMVYRDSTKYLLTACSAVNSGELHVDPAVHTVSGDAFRGCTKLTSVIFDDNVQTIGEYAFFGSTEVHTVTFGAGLKELDRYSIQCPKLKTVQCAALTPPDASSYAFYSVKVNEATLFVPEESLDAYREASVWKEFGTILAEKSAALDDIADNQSSNRKYIEDGQLFILRGDKTYTANGAEVK